MATQTIASPRVPALDPADPVIGLWHSGGAKPADGVESMDGVGQIFAAMTRASLRMPQISVVLGPAAAPRHTARR